ncbi:Na(+)/H(+) antiporter subunit C [Cellulomonas sp. KRMCY2]|uniref:Na(+)/H(+) antiporter subunit C n=1 Tax=Cellulomonas sp. KRMCY2 TaxID=1304865 RepID=UPI00045EB021|nr:Na(+)/H(+) antiporter subunit C [Cellulomonas sp. KRMCY2]
MIDTSPNLVLVAVVVVLVTAGVYLLLERSLSRVLLGVIILGNGVNLLFLVAGGAAGGAPIIGQTPEGQMSDPLPQAMVLTAIVITLGMTAFLLAMAYRSWQLNGHDEVQDDLEDRRIARRAAADLAAFEDSDAVGATNLDEDAAEVRDETGSDDEPPVPADTPADASAPATGGDAR